MSSIYAIEYKPDNSGWVLCSKNLMEVKSDVAHENLREMRREFPNIEYRIVEYVRKEQSDGNND